MRQLLIRPLKRSDFRALLGISLELFSQHNEADFPFTESHLYSALNGFLANKACYFRGMFLDGELVAWMLAVPGHSNHHSPITGMSQVYYHSNLNGLLSVRALTEFHENFFEYVERKGLQIAVTSSSLPNADKFVRILERAGWSRVSDSRLTRVTKFHPRQRQGRRGVLGGTDVLRADGAPEGHAVIAH